MARSLTVPFTARSPILPPGKNSGCTTYESVVKARRAPATAQHRAVMLRIAQRARERRPEDAVDQLLRQPAAAAVREQDPVFGSRRKRALETHEDTLASGMRRYR